MGRPPPQGANVTCALAEPLDSGSEGAHGSGSPSRLRGCDTGSPGTGPEVFPGLLRRRQAQRPGDRRSYPPAPRGGRHHLAGKALARECLRRQEPVAGLCAAQRGTTSPVSMSSRSLRGPSVRITSKPCSTMSQ